MKKYIKLFYFILTISLIAPIVIFIWHFKDQQYSDSISDWGTFGDFIGGVLATIIALANLYIFIKLTSLVAETQNKNNLQQIETQKRVAMGQLRYEAIKEISQHLNPTVPTMLMKEEVEATLYASLQKHIFMTFVDNNGLLFNKLKGQDSSGMKLAELLGVVEQGEVEQAGGLMKVLIDFEGAKNEFLQMLQQEMIDDLNKGN
jgi:hypothetical protein